jgi:hypothetical protein
MLPASVGHIHDVFEEYDRIFAKTRTKQPSLDQERQTSRSSRRIKPVRDMPLMPNDEGLVHDETLKESFTRSIIGSPAEVASDGAFADHVTNTGPDAMPSRGDEDLQQHGRQQAARGIVSSEHLLVTGEYIYLRLSLRSRLIYLP